jgi:hypothetical protein
MAIRWGGAPAQCVGESSTQPDPDWLRDLPTPGPGGVVKPPAESIPAPPAKAGGNSSAVPGDGFKLPPQAVPAPAINPGDAPDKGLGDGFELHPRSKPAANDKPAIKGLE